MTLLLVAIGGLVGTLARYGLSVWIQSIWTIVAVNVGGSFVLGLLVHAGAGWSNQTRTALGVGLLGGFTTFSTLTVQTVMEADGGRPEVAAAYLAATVIGGMAAAYAGFVLGRHV